MQRVILVVSPDTEFLQQMRSHLEEGGRYQVTVALNAHDALNLANSNFFEVAIVDGELDDIPVAAFCRDLTALQSDLKILVFPPDNNAAHPVLEGLAVNGYLTKPFSGQEIGKALSGLFSDQPMAGNIQVKVVDDLVKQWLQIPETGGRKAEQILEATSAQAVLIIIKDQLIASAGSMDDGLAENVTGFLSRYWKDEENSELARYIKLEGDSSNRFLYATKLVSNVVLVLVYPMKATIQLVRRELNRVKDDFQQHYPTTGELRQDIAKQTLAEINKRNKKLSALQSNTPAFSQNELDVLIEMQETPLKSASSSFSQDEIDALKAKLQTPSTPPATPVSQVELDARKLFEQELQKLNAVADKDVSQSELDALNLLEQSMAQPSADAATQAELEARKLFEQESKKSKPTIAAISQEEIDLLKALNETPTQPAADAVSQAELEARKLFEQESQKPKPTIAAISQEEIDLLKALNDTPPQPAGDAVSQAELEARKLFEQESLNSKPKPTINGVSQEELDLLKAMQNAPQQPAANAVTQAELEARKLFEQESLNSKPKPTINGVSQEELDLLKAMQNTPQQPAADAVSQAELEARKLFEQESLKSKPIPTINGVSQEELDLLKAMQNAPQQPAADAVSQAELEARKLFEQESLNSKPKPTINGVSQDELDLLKAQLQIPAQPSAEGTSQAELDARRLFEQESVKPKPNTSAISQDEIDLLKAQLQPPSEPAPATVPQVELEALQSTPTNIPGISEQELSQLSQLLDQMPAPDPQAETETQVEEKKLPEWLNELEATGTSAQSAEAAAPQPIPATETIPAGTPPFFGIDANIKAAIDSGAPLPEIDFKLPWETEESSIQAEAQALSEPSAVVINGPVIEPVAEQSVPVVETTIEKPVNIPVETPVTAVVETPVETQPPAPASFADVLNSVTPQVESIPASAAVVPGPTTTTIIEPIIAEEPVAPPPPPTLKEFRFNYTLVLMPADHAQFLTRTLSEKISGIMPDIHEDQGWRMTNITVRPQYLLWTVAVPMGVCPHRILQEVRTLTSNSIFANFPEIAKTKTSNDFWSSDFLAVSGSEPPPANLIFEFVNNVWKTPEPATP